MGDMADYYQEQDEARLEDGVRFDDKPTQPPITFCHQVEAVVVGFEGTNHYECPVCHESVNFDGSNPQPPEPEDKPCGVCGERKPVNKFCSNDCQYLLDGPVEDVIPTILAHAQHNAEKGKRGTISIAFRQIDYIYKHNLTKLLVEAKEQGYMDAVDKEVNRQIGGIMAEARIMELKELKAYDWYGTDDNGNENVYFNDEISKYAEARIAELSNLNQVEG